MCQTDFIILEVEPSIQRGLNDTHVLKLDETRKNGSNSKCVCVCVCVFFKSGTSYSIKPTQPKSKLIH